MNAAMKAFFSSEGYAVVGVSRSCRKFGNTIFCEMHRKRYRVVPVHPMLESFDGVRCVPDVASLPDDVRSVIIVVSPHLVVPILAQCKERGIDHVWLQPGAESDEAVGFAVQHGINVIHGRCVLMFVEPVRSIHSVHRWIDRLRGVYPEESESSGLQL